MDVSEASDHILIKIKMQNLSQEPQASSKTPNKNLKYIYVLCTLKIKIEKERLKYASIKDQWLYPYTDQNAKP